MGNTIQITILILYFTIMAAVGTVSRRPTRSAVGFFVGGRRGTTLLITASLVATVMGGSATVGMAGMGFNWGLTGIWWLLVGSIGLVILGVFFSKKLRSTGYYTLPQLAENQYDKRVSIAVSVLIVIAWVGIIAGQIIAAGKIISIIGIEHKNVWMIGFAAVFIIYTLVGGQRANLRTDLLQFVIIFLGLLAAIAVVLPKLDGLRGMKARLPADYFNFPLSKDFGVYQLFSWLLLIGMTYIVGPDMYTRLFSAKNENAARNSALIGAILIIPPGLCIVLLGMSARVLFPATLSAEAALPFLIGDQLPPIVGGLVLAAFVGAMMSSADTCLVSTGAIISNDIVKKIVPLLSDEQTVLVARIAIIVIGILALLFALVLDSVISSLMFAYTVYTGGVVIPVLAGFFKKRLNLSPLGAIAAISGGGIAALLSKLFAIKYLDLGALGISAVLLFAVSYIDRRFLHN